MNRLLILIFGLTLGAVILQQRGVRESGPIDEAKVLDLTYDFDEQTIYWPTAKGFRWERDAWGKTEGGYWYASGSYMASEHGGTHLDSPLHFAEGKASTDQIQLSRLIGPAVVVDISRACAANPDYRLQPADLAGWEKQHGRIPDGAILLVR